jgi:type IV secretion system protein VirB2
MRIIESIQAKALQAAAAALALSAAIPHLARAQGFDKINTTVTNINTILVTISIAVVTIAIIWAGFKMIFQGARLADVANVLIGGTLVGGAAAFASYIVT